jgi:aspartyl-tRNA synthetase
MCFVVVREGYASVQCVLFVGEKISKGMVTFASKIPKESIIEVIAEVSKPSSHIDGCSQQVELQVVEFWCINRSVPILPFQLEDASRKVTN